MNSKFTYEMIEDAQILLERGLYKQLSFYETYVGQLAHSLAVYQERGEYSGTFSDAVNCLELAGYELEDTK